MALSCGERLLAAARRWVRCLLALAVVLVAVLLGIKESDALRPGRGVDVPKSLRPFNVLITGASSGIGYSTAVLMCKMHANLVLHGPNENRTSRAVEELRQAAPDACSSKALVAELDDYDQVTLLARRTNEHFGRVDVLILNAGLHYGGPVKPGKVGDFMRQRLLRHPKRFFASKNGQDDHVMAVNHFGHFLLTIALLSSLSPTARIVVVSGNGMWTGDWQRVVAPRRFPWEHFRMEAVFAYHDSKLANVCFARALRRRRRDLSVIIHDPGLITTSMAVGRDTEVYAARRFGLDKAAFHLYGWPMSADDAAERLLQAVFLTRPATDVVYSYWLPPTIMRWVQDHRLIPNGMFARSKISSLFVQLQGATFGPLYAGVGPGCGDGSFLTYFWNYSLVHTGLDEYVDMRVMKAYEEKYLGPGRIPPELRTPKEAGYLHGWQGWPA